MTNEEQSLALSSHFSFGEISPGQRRVAVPEAASLGPLALFTGTFIGTGFNTIFRPQNPVTPTPQVPPGDNLLELNLTSEEMTFSKPLLSVPNRGFGQQGQAGAQGDIFLSGVPYLQSITDITNPAEPVGIHVEPGLWMMVPASLATGEAQTIVRMASIPHGTTIVAQGTVQGPTTAQQPNIPPVSINPSAGAPFPSQTADNPGTARVPQDLSRVPGDRFDYPGLAHRSKHVYPNPSPGPDSYSVLHH